MKNKSTSKFDLDGVPPVKEALPLGLQHVLAMVVGNMVPAILIAHVVGLSQGQATMLIQGSMLAAAIATFIQLYPIPLFGGYKIGSRLPVMMGMSYVFLGAVLSVASKYGLAVLFGAQIAGAAITIFIGMSAKKIRKLFTPVISGTIVTCMGIGLFPVAIRNMAGGIGSDSYGAPVNFAVASIVAVVIVMATKFGKGLVKDISILIGIVVGYVISLFFGMVDFSAVQGAAWFAIPKPLAFGIEFRPEVIVMFTIIYAIAVADIMGAYTIVTIGAFERPVDDQELSSGVIGSSVGSIISSVFSAIPVGVFSQNSAIVAMNKVVSRYVIAVGTAFILVAGVSPKIGALMTTIPAAVVGGATLVVFALIAMAGVMLITMEEFTEKNKLIAGLGVTTSIGFVSAPDALGQFPEIIQILFGGSSIVAGSIVAILLNLVFQFVEDRKRSKEAGLSEKEAVQA